MGYAVKPQQLLAFSFVLLIFCYTYSFVFMLFTTWVALVAEDSIVLVVKVVHSTVLELRDHFYRYKIYDDMSFFGCTSLI